MTKNVNNSSQKAKMARKKPQLKQKVYEKMKSLPKDTREVEKELQELGITHDKIGRWKKNPFAFVSTQDAFTLAKYFDCEVSELFESNK